MERADIEELGKVFRELQASEKKRQGSSWVKSVAPWIAAIAAVVGFVGQHFYFTRSEGDKLDMEVKTQKAKIEQTEENNAKLIDTQQKIARTQDRLTIQQEVLFRAIPEVAPLLQDMPAPPITRARAETIFIEDPGE